MRWLLPLCLVLAGCPRETLSGVTADTSVLTTEVDFGSLTLGATTRRSVVLRNASRISEAIEVLITAPFAGPASFTIEPGDNELELTFAPTALGAFDATASLNGVLVTLHGVGIPVPECIAGQCEDAQVDVSTGTCVRTPKADGASCAGSACLADGVCRSGSCIGTVRNCDDANACTTDACTESEGCIHLDQSASCPPVSDPCHAPACDPRTGCGSAIVSDGTPCGEVSCTIANVCLNGACRQVVPPDGFLCSPATPCQGEGHCQSQQCARPAKTVLDPLWTHLGEGPMFFEGVADPAGSLYWVECNVCPPGTPCDAPNPPDTCEAVSFTSNGLERYRTRLVAKWFPVAQLFDGGHFIVAFQGSVMSIDGASGAVEWVVELADAHVQALATSMDGSVLFVEHAALSTTQGSITRLSTASGMTLSRFSRSGSFGGLVVDRLNQAWVGWETANTSRLLKVDASTAQEQPLTESKQPVSVDATEVVMHDDDVHSLSTMLRTHSTLLTGASSSLQLTTGRLRTVAGSTGYALVTPANTQLAVLGQSAVGPFATRDALLSANGNWSGFTIDLRTRDGALVTSCETSSYLAVGGPTVFTGSHLAMMTECAVCIRGESLLQVFDVGPLGLPATGWVAPNGGPGNTRHPR